MINLIKSRNENFLLSEEGKFVWVDKDFNFLRFSDSIEFRTLKKKIGLYIKPIKNISLRDVKNLPKYNLKYRWYSENSISDIQNFVIAQEGIELSKKWIKENTVQFITSLEDSESPNTPIGLGVRNKGGGFIVICGEYFGFYCAFENFTDS